MAAKSSNTALLKKSLECHKQGLPSKKIVEELKNPEFKVSKSVIAEIIKKNN
ncbi:MAG: hypothetical protein Q8S41_09640 [Lutibacter sp.]|nr:hypothetical protein [Lutibacter sp.]